MRTMRFASLILLCISLAVPVSAFVPGRSASYAAARECLLTTGTFKTCRHVAAPLNQVNQESDQYQQQPFSSYHEIQIDDNEDEEDDDVDDDNIHDNSNFLEPEKLEEYTNILLDEKSYPVGALPLEVVTNSFAVLFQWRRDETPYSAEMVERLMDRYEREDPTIMNTRHYTVAVAAWAKSGHKDAPLRAEAIVERMQKIAETKNPLAGPTKWTLSHVLNAYTLTGNATGAYSVLLRMEEDPHMTPSFIDYNEVMAACAREGQPRMAEDVLKKVVMLCREHSEAYVPDVFNYNMVLDSWAKSREPGAAERSLEILKVLHELVDQHGQVSLQPDARTYCAVINAISRERGDYFVKQAQQVFDEAFSRGVRADSFLYNALIQTYAKAGQPEKTEELLERMEQNGISSSVVSNNVLKAWKLRASPEAPERAERILDRMLSAGLADHISFTTVIGAYANRGDFDSAAKAALLFQRMEELYHQGNKNLKPTVQTFNTVMNGWVQGGDAERSEILLNRMEQQLKEGKSDIGPNVFSYSTVLNGWSKSKRPDSTARAERVFERMVEMYEAGHDDARPNMVSYVTLINALARNKAEVYAEKAQEILFRMYEEYRAGNRDVKPNAILVAKVADCWGKSATSKSGLKAEELLDWMIDIFRREKDEDLAPNEFVFSSVISAWGRSRSFGKAARARRVLQKMRDLYESGTIPAAPNTACYTAVLNSCAYTMYETSEKREALKIALETYKEIEQTTYGQPNRITYATLIAALANLLPPGEQRTSAIEKIFKRCCERGQTDMLVMRRLETTLSREDLIKVCRGAKVGMDGTVASIPDKWQRNVRR